MDPNWIPSWLLQWCYVTMKLAQSDCIYTNDQATLIPHYFLSVFPRIQQIESLGFGFEKSLDFPYEISVQTFCIVSTVWVILGFFLFVVKCRYKELRFEQFFLQTLRISKCCFYKETKQCMQSAWEAWEIHAESVVKEYEGRIQLIHR
jgi:hypothetical protein